MVSPDTTVAEAGNTLILPCVAYTILSNNTSTTNPLTITWRRGDRALINGSGVIVHETETISRDEGIVIIQSLLELCDVQTADSGVYSCEVEERGSGGRDAAEFNLHALTANGNDTAWCQ